MRDFDWQSLWIPTLPPWEVAFRAAIVYLGVQVLFRLAGRKELGSFSVFDLIVVFLVTTAMRQSIVADDTSLTSAFVGLTTLLALDRGLSIVTNRWRRARDLITGPVRRLMRDGEFEDETLRRVRLTREDLLENLRTHGTDDLSRVRDAYLERNGNVTFVMRDKARPRQE